MHIRIVDGEFAIVVCNLARGLYDSRQITAGSSQASRQVVELPGYRLSSHLSSDETRSGFLEYGKPFQD